MRIRGAAQMCQRAGAPVALPDLKFCAAFIQLWLPILALGWHLYLPIPMPRSLHLGLCALVVLSGCTSTRQWSASQSNPDELAWVTNVFKGQTVWVHMLAESDQGRFVEALSDSTRWVRRDGTLRTVSTSNVQIITTGPGSSRELAGTAIGLLVVGSLLKVSADGLNDQDANTEDLVGFLFVAALSPIIVGIGFVAGASSTSSEMAVWINP